ncbi:MAG: PIN domain-containing protein [Firmicutes bacterium]|nr:PIN domain-containing protein [Bacillota bacterium]
MVLKTMMTIFTEERIMLNDKIFIDTGAWIACMNKSDIHHQSSVSYMMELRKKQIPLITSNYVIDETLTWFSYHNLHDIAVKVMGLWQEAEKNNSLKIYWVDKAISKEAWEIFYKFSEHRLSFTDCTSFAICKEIKVQKIFGFDSHFNMLGFLLSPCQIQENQAKYDVLKP